MANRDYLPNTESVEKLVEEWDQNNSVEDEISDPDNSGGDPALPSHLAEAASKSTDEIMSELNKLPFFMNDETPDKPRHDTPELEALRALASEGNPEEIAQSYRARGNDQYRLGRFQAAVDYYTQALAVETHIKPLEAALYLNRAACNLELKNYRRCINDSKECLLRQPRNVKALFRSARAYDALERYEEARQILAFAVSIDNTNPAINTLLRNLESKIVKSRELRKKKEEEKQRQLNVDKYLKEALAMRNILSIRSTYSPGPIGDAKLHLEDDFDIETQLVFPTLILYPTIDEFDIVTEVGELTIPLDLMELVMDRPDEYFQDGKHDYFRPKHLESYMETEDGGLLRMSRRAPFSQVLMSLVPRTPIFDNILRVYFVPKIHAKEWLANWSKADALARRLD